ncbi:hypothetical protein PUNSTDRAFT_54475 [Punctularia strigosozonata HHB-11173 SS5]|uniref:uncharacterized protein n=1 Tax=Punctularia strigosozonata (strain HHB-11173) TaxID=741275 RepID=UPI00044165FC|nr:uncharacterized protein PUNSTDRAFT_54475 [Punctularia strigosozonata HHB-11173 SS5]EIN06202.1 hypothetical protein PUNSTDRAFT_54475 [Punctularia strigosozonata HHB-11173 SS5]
MAQMQTVSAAIPRANRYKEKFHSLRERYDQVNAQHETYVRELATADAKMKRLQAECELLLDAVALAAPAQPTLMQYLLPPDEALNGHGLELHADVEYGAPPPNGSAPFIPDPETYPPQQYLPWSRRDHAHHSDPYSNGRNGDTHPEDRAQYQTASGQMTPDGVHPPGRESNGRAPSQDDVRR